MRARRTGLIATKRIFIVGTGYHIGEIIRQYQPWELGASIVGCRFLTPAPNTASPQMRSDLLDRDIDATVESARSLEPDAILIVTSWSDTATIDRCIDRLFGGRIDELRQRLRDSEGAVVDYKSTHKIIDVTQGNKLIGRQIEDMTQQLALARTRTADARGRLDRLQEVTKQKGDFASLGEALQSPVVSNLRTQQAESARLAAEYSALYGDRHPALVAVRAQMADIRQQIDREVARILVGVRNEYQVAVSREASLETELTKLKDQSESLGQADVKLHELEREAQANRALFEQYLGRVKETSEEQGMQIPDARIVSPALTPLKPERPSAVLLLIVAGIFGTMLAVGILLLLERTRRGFRRPSEIEQVLSLPGIGILPNEPKQFARANPPLPAILRSPPPPPGCGRCSSTATSIRRRRRVHSTSAKRGFAKSSTRRRRSGRPFSTTRKAACMCWARATSRRGPMPSPSRRPHSPLC